LHLLVATLAEVVPLPRPLDRRRGLQERLDLPAKGLFIPGRQQVLAALPPRVARQRQLDRLPRPLVGDVQRRQHPLTLVAELVPEEIQQRPRPVPQELVQRQAAEAAYYFHVRNSFLVS